MVSPLKASPRTARMVRELTQIHFRQHTERISWRSQLVALKDALEDVPRLLEEQPDNAFSRLQARCRVLEEEVAQEKLQVKRLEIQLEKQRRAFQSQVTSLEKRLEDEKSKRIRASGRVRELLQTATLKNRESPF